MSKISYFFILVTIPGCITAPLSPVTENKDSTGSSVFMGGGVAAIEYDVTVFPNKSESEGGVRRKGFGVDASHKVPFPLAEFRYALFKNLNVNASLSLPHLGLGVRWHSLLGDGLYILGVDLSRRYLQLQVENNKEIDFTGNGIEGFKGNEPAFVSFYFFDALVSTGLIFPLNEFVSMSSRLFAGWRIATLTNDHFLEFSDIEPREHYAPIYGGTFGAQFHRFVLEFGFLRFSSDEIKTSNYSISAGYSFPLNRVLKL